jgi:hypothetical protein
MHCRRARSTFFQEAASRWPSRGLWAGQTHGSTLTDAAILPLTTEFAPSPFVTPETQRKGRPPVAPTAAWVASPYQLLARYRDPPPAMLEFLADGSGPLGVAPTCIVRPRAFDPARCPMMHDRRARSTTKSGFPMAFSGPSPRIGFTRIFALPSRLMAPGPNHGGHITEPGITADLSAIQDYSDRGFFKRTIRAVNADGVIPGTRDACPSEPGRTIINLSVNSLERPGIPL